MLLAALVCAFVCIIGLNLHAKTLLDDNIEKAIYYNNVSSKNCSDYVMEKVLNERSIVVLGSSELSFSNSPAYPPKLFNYGNSDFNMVLKRILSVYSPGYQCRRLIEQHKKQ